MNPNQNPNQKKISIIIFVLLIAIIYNFYFKNNDKSKKMKVSKDSFQKMKIIKFNKKASDINKISKKKQLNDNISVNARSKKNLSNSYKKEFKKTYDFLHVVYPQAKIEILKQNETKSYQIVLVKIFAKDNMINYNASIDKKTGLIVNKWNQAYPSSFRLNNKSHKVEYH